MKSVRPILGGLSAVLVVAFAIAVWVAWPSAPPTAAPVEPIPSPIAPVLTHVAASNAPAVPAPSQVPEVIDPYEPIVRDGGPLHVSRLVVASGVAGREPRGASDVFTAGEHERTYAFVELANEGPATSIRVVFTPEVGESTGHVELAVPAGARRFRTWAFSRFADTPGRWQVALLDEHDREIARRSFDVVR